MHCCCRLPLDPQECLSHQQAWCLQLHRLTHLHSKMEKESKGIKKGPHAVNILTKWSTYYLIIVVVQWHTLTSDTGIFRMDTIVNTNSTVRAVPKSGLSAIAGHIIQQDGSSSLAKCSRGEGCCTCEENVVQQSATLCIPESAIENFRKCSGIQTTVYIDTCWRES